MKSIAVIGAGQLGSRHLQGIIKYLEKLKIIVLDPSLDSLQIAKERALEIDHNHEIIYTQSWNELPEVIDLVIIATNSNIRESVINQLIPKYHVKFLILEKVLFQDLEAYERVHNLLKDHAITTYVNHSRRMSNSYKQLKTILRIEKQNMYNVVGGDWGLGCNALHFLDLFVYLSGKKLSDLNVDCINNELLDSKRQGFVEFTGTITGRMSDGSLFSISSLKGQPSAITTTIFNEDDRFIIQEVGTPKIYELSSTNSFKLISYDFINEYQSGLTYKLLNELFNDGLCSLPTYDEARHTHELFIKAMLKKYNQITGFKEVILPIT